jgi:putative ABC transport system permease protein
MLSPRWKKVFADLWQNKSRTALVVISTAIGVFAFGGMFIARAVLDENLAQGYESRQPADISITLAEPFDDDLARWAEGQPHVVAAQEVTSNRLQIIANGEQYDLLLVAYEEYDSITVSQVVPTRGVFPPGRDEITIERSFLSRLGIELGDTVTIKVDEDDFYDVTLTGLVNDLTIQSGNTNSLVKGWVDLRTLNRMDLSADPNQIDIAIERADAANPNVPTPIEIVDDLRQRLVEGGYSVRAVSYDEDGKSWAVDILNAQTTTFAIVGTAALLLSSSLVANIIAGLLAAQKKQIGIMKIVGATRGQIVPIYLAMVMLFGGIALLIALPLSIGFANGLSNGFGPNVLNFDINTFRVPTEIIVLEVIVAFAVPMLSALNPILSGTRVTPAAAISDNQPGSQNNPLDLLLARLGGLPRPLLLSLRNTFRKKGRLLATAVTLALAGTLFMSIVNVRAGLDVLIEEIVQTSNFDVQVTLDEPINQAGIERRILDLPGVTSVEGWLTTSVRYQREDNVQSDNFTLFGLPAESRYISPIPNEGRWLEPRTRLNRYDLVVTSGLTDREPLLTVGSEIDLRRGDQVETWRIVGEIQADIPLAYADYDSVARFAGEPDTVNRIQVTTVDKDPETYQIVLDEMLAYFDERDIEVVGSSFGTTLRRDLGAVFNIFAFTLLGTSMLIAIVAGLGLAGTMSLNVLERTREIGVLRSVGAATNSIRFMYVLEGFLVGLLSFLIALPLVAPVTWLLCDFLGRIAAGRPVPYALSATGAPIWLAIVVVVAVLSSLSPAQRAAQISIREALSYE